MSNSRDKKENENASCQLEKIDLLVKVDKREELEHKVVDAYIRDDTLAPSTRERISRSYEELQVFIYQTNRRFFLLWLAIGISVLISAVTIAVGILK